MDNTEGRIVLALQAYQLDQFSSLQAATHMYNVSHTTLYRRNQGTPSQSNFTSLNQKLT
jgi:hypothetical protein